MSNQIGIGDRCILPEYGEVVVTGVPGVKDYDSRGYIDAARGCTVAKVGSMGDCQWIHQERLDKIPTEHPTYKELAEKMGIKVSADGDIRVSSMFSTRSSYHATLQKDVNRDGYVSNHEGKYFCHASKIKELAVALLLWDELYGEQSETS